MRILITGGAGFIGSAVTRHCVEAGHEVIVADRFTYAGKGRALAPILRDIRVLMGDLSTGDLAERCAAVEADWIVHMAAETHVDRAITHPESFLVSNALGTTRLLQALTHDCVRLPAKILVYSTDEVFGSTPANERYTEQQPYAPSNAYSASKVAVEAIAHAFWITHDLPVLVVRPCNTYGPGQHPEKLIPKFIELALRGKPMTVYNDGTGARDWLFTTDHAQAVDTLLHTGMPGESYNLAAGDEHTDSEMAQRIGEWLKLRGAIERYSIVYQPGRPGHDRRYWMDSSKLRALGWTPQMPFSDGLRGVIDWHLTHRDWYAHDYVTMGAADDGAALGKSAV